MSSVEFLVLEFFANLNWVVFQSIIYWTAVQVIGSPTDIPANLSSFSNTN